MMINFKIKGVGIDTTTLDYVPVNALSTKKALSYVFTNPAANNDFIIEKFVEYNDKASLITEINYVDGVDDVLKSHLKVLKRKSYDLLLMNANLEYEVFDTSIKSIQDLGIVNHFGLSCPKDLDTLKKNIEYLEAIGCKIECVLLEINPENFQKEIIEYCSEANLSIFSTNSFGGWLDSARMISTYTAPYLLNLAALYSDVVILSSRDYFTATVYNAEYLTNLIDKVVENEDIYNLASSSKIKQVIKPKIQTAIVVNNMTLPYESSSYIFNPDELILKTSNIFPEILRPNDEKTKVESDVESLISVIYKPEDIGDDDYFAILRYKIEEFLDISHPGRTKFIIKVTDKLLHITYHNIKEKRTWYGKKYTVIDNVDRYMLYYNDGLVEFFEENNKKGEENT